MPAFARVSTAIGDLASSFTLALEAQNKSARTIQTYLEGFRLFLGILVSHGLPTEVRAVRRAHVESFVADLLSRHTPATANNRYRALRAFFRWAEIEGEVELSPMSKMTPPKIPERPVPVLSEADMTSLLRACAGHGFADLRDETMVRLLLDTGMRRGELAGLRVADIDLVEKTAAVIGKGRRPRVVGFGRRTAAAIDRYLRRARRSHRATDSPALWLGHAGPTEPVSLTETRRHRII